MNSSQISGLRSSPVFGVVGVSFGVSMGVVGEDGVEGVTGFAGVGGAAVISGCFFGASFITTCWISLLSSTLNFTSSATS